MCFMPEHPDLGACHAMTHWDLISSAIQHKQESDSESEKMAVLRQHFALLAAQLDEQLMFHNVAHVAPQGHAPVEAYQDATPSNPDDHAAIPSSPDNNDMTRLPPHGYVFDTCVSCRCLTHFSFAPACGLLTCHP